MMTIMKLKYIISAIAIVALSSSCQDFLNLSDPDKVTVGNYYQTETDLEQSLFGAYAKMKTRGRAPQTRRSSLQAGAPRATQEGSR